MHVFAVDNGDFNVAINGTVFIGFHSMKA